MKIISFLLLAFSVVVLSPAVAQKGYLAGKVVDGETAEPLIGATISKEGTTIGTVADFDGNYSLALDEGTHDIILQFVSYQTMKITDVNIKSGETTVLDLKMSTDATELQTVVVTAEVAKSSEIGLLTVQKKSANLLDGISSQTFRKIGDGNMASAMKRVTGVSVQDGKYIYVRGLGDRYTKTTLNEMAIPGLDPDNNAVQIDLFPTAILENVVVYKTFSPDLMGDFSGGMVNVETKEFPEEKWTSISVGMGYNPAMNLRDDFILYKGGKNDFMGFDDGGRELPVDKDLRIPSVAGNNPELEKITRSFSPGLAAQKRYSLLNSSFSINHGNQLIKDNHTIGYNAVFNYRDKYEYYDRTFFGDYLKNIDPQVTNLQPFGERSGEEGKRDVLWSGLLSGALKFDRHSFSASLLRSQNGISTAADRVSQDFEQTGATLDQDILSYMQRSMTNAIVVGKHQLNLFNVEWRGGLSYSSIYEPDFRSTSISVTQGDTSLSVGDGAGMNRFWRNLDEINRSAKIDITYPFGENSKLKFGALGILKERDFEVLNYTFRVTDPGNVPADPDWFLKDENIWSPAEGQGTYVVGNSEPANAFNSAQHINSFYIMADMKVLEKLRAIYGVRMEQAKMFYTGQNNLGTVVYQKEPTLNEVDFLPSVNLIFNMQEEMNLRASFNKTLARPTFREKSIAQIYDPISDRTFIGNIDLKQTNINNYDIRWEYFFKRGEILSVSGFYKQFEGHIELSSFEVAPDNLKPRNSGKSIVYGTEIEFRKTMDFISTSLSNFSFGSNITFVRSEIDLGSVVINNKGKTEYELRKESLREGEQLSKTRVMAGQAPYLINAYLNYTTEGSDMNASLSYNVQGETLSIVGSGRVPDVYTKPFHSLNLNISKNFGAEKRSGIALGINNILNNSNEMVYRSYKADEIYFSVYKPSTTYSVKYSYTF
jgi:hypothetical protein